MDFVSFDLAKKLKEKGYPQSPDYFNYSSYYDWDGLRKIHSLCNASVWFDSNISRDNIYFAPTISQVLKWLSDKKEVDLVIEPIYFFDENRRREYGVRVFAPWWNKPMHCGYFNTREEAALMGIEYVIDKLIL